MKILLLVVGVIASSGQLLAADASAMSASDVINRSEAAYAAVKTYVGTTTMRMKTDVGDKTSDKVSTAKVTFVRPGKVRIDGKSGLFDFKGKGGQPFAIVSDGTKTWSTAIQNNGAFSEAQNLNLAGASVGSMGVAETILAALMKNEGGTTMPTNDPFLVPRQAGATIAGHETIDGADCYKLVSKHPQLSDVTLWIDAKSFLLRQMTRETDGTKLAAAAKAAEEVLKKMGKQPPANASAAKSMSHHFSFTIDKVDGPVDANLFANPTK